MKFSRFLILSLILNAACGSKNHSSPTPLTMPTDDTTPKDEGEDPVGQPLFIEQIPADILSQLRAKGCTITNRKGVSSCQAPTTVEAADELFLQLDQLSQSLREIDEKTMIQPELYDTWIFAQFEAGVALDRAAPVAKKLDEINAVKAGIESTTATLLIMDLYFTYTERYNAALFMDGLVKNPEFLAQVKRLNIDTLFAFRENLYFRSNDSSQLILAFNPKGDAAALQDYVARQELK